MSWRLERVDLIFNLLGEDKTSDQITLELTKFERRKANARGNETLQRALRYSKILPHVVKVDVSDKKTEDPMGVDLWFTMSNKSKLFRLMPVQIKSSDKGVESFRSSRHYTETWGKKIFVLNVGSKISRTAFKTAYKNEVARIEKLLGER